MIITIMMMISIMIKLIKLSILFKIIITIIIMKENRNTT